MSKDELGTLIIVILKARHLNDKHSFRKQDVFAKATLNGVENKTPVDIKGGQHPVWDAEMRFSVPKATGSKNRKLEVACYAKEPRSDDLLGTGSVDITETLKTGEFDEWIPLSIDGVVRGDIYLEMTYYANAPAPLSGGLTVPTSNSLNRRPSKLSPSERPSRPAAGPALRPVQHTNSIPSSPGPSYAASPTGNYVLPSFPEGRPTYGSSPTNPGPVPVPSFLRPGSAQPSPSSPPKHSQGYLNQGVTSSLPSGQQVYDHKPASANLPNPYLTPSTSTPSSLPAQYTYDNRLVSSTPVPSGQLNPYFGPSTSPTSSFGGYHPPPQGPLIFRTSSPAIPASHTTVLSGPPPIWTTTITTERPPGGFAFPMPVLSPTRDANPYPSSFGVPPQSQSMYNADIMRNDAHLQARYQSPLPLPPNPPVRDPIPSSPSQPIPAVQAAPPPQPTLALRTTPPPQPTRAVVRTTPPKASKVSKSPKAEIKADAARVAALRKAEDEAARRRKQELKDLELAMQLDKELNAAEELANNLRNSSRIPRS